ncbi:hypothetical protein TWF481_009036 [Arthrobotrys musiformis]|uniref:Uncharacterized protein n=1 Tax=Arthrobotrys musiformis TaxID=47236 RepID=A0AAV9W2M6_9PEZI
MLPMTKNISNRNDLTLNPSAPVFKPSARFEPRAETVAQGRDISFSALDGLSENMDLLKSVDSHRPKPPGSTQTPSPSSYMQQKLERLVYLATRGVLQKSPSDTVTRLSTDTAQRLIKAHVNPSHLGSLLKKYKLDELVEVMVRMHAEQVYTSSLETITEKWPWLLAGNISEVDAMVANVSSKSPPNTISKAQTVSTLKGSPVGAELGSAPSLKALRAARGPKASNAYARSAFDDDTYSIASFDPSGGSSRAIDPYNIYFPYPTLRAILKETRRILKSAFYDFIKEFFPEKLDSRAYEFSESSSLGQLILVVQDTISDMDNHHCSREAIEKLTHLRNVDSHTDCLHSANEVYDLVSRRRDISISGLNPLLDNLVGLLDALGAGEWSKKQRALNIFTTVLATDIKKKFEAIQGPIRTTLQRIRNEREKLAAEEEVATRKYREDEKEVQRHFMLDGETLRGTLLSQASSDPKPSNPKSSVNRTPENSRELPMVEGIETLDAMKSKPSTPPEICVWDPQKQLIDYRPNGTELHPGTQEGKTVIGRYPWDTASIDLALNEVNSKENIQHDAHTASPNVLRPGVAPRPSSQFSKHSLEIMIPPKHSKAIPIRRMEEPSPEPNVVTKAEPMMKRHPPQLELNTAQEPDLLIDL